MHSAPTDNSRTKVAVAILAGVLSILAVSQAPFAIGLADKTFQGGKP